MDSGAKDHSLQEPLIDQEDDDSRSPQITAHTFTFANGITRSISQRDVDASCMPEWIWGETKKQLYVAGPLICVGLLQYSLLLVSNMFVGHLGELQLASASIASSFAGVTGTSLIYGMASALETLCGQAYGAKQYHMLGIYLQRAVIVLYVVSIPISIVWWNMGHVLRFLGQDPVISEMAGQYARCLIPFLFSVSTFHPLVKFLQTQSVVLPMPLFSILTLIIHIPFCYFLVYKTSLGFLGAAIAGSISNWLDVLWLVLYIKFSSNCSRTWTSFSREAFNDVIPFLKLAIPSTIMICLEFWSFQGVVIISGLLPNPRLETSTLSICIITIALLYMIPNGISAGVSTRVSNELGGGRPRAAKGAVGVGVAMGLTEGILLALLLYMGRSVWGWAFTSEKEVVDYVSQCIPFVAVVAVMDALQAVVSGVARGCGWQAYAAAANLGSYYIVGLPVAFVLAFVYDFKVIGLCMGLFVGIFTQAVVLVILTLMTDWRKQAENALDRVYSTASATLPIESNQSQKDEIPSLFKFKDHEIIS